MPSGILPELVLSMISWVNPFVWDRRVLLLLTLLDLLLLLLVIFIVDHGYDIYGSYAAKDNDYGS